MRFSELFSQQKKVLSFEFFPPKTEAALPDTLRLIANLAECGPDFMTVTYGANGGARANSFQLTQFIQGTVGLPAVQHLTCVGHSVTEIDSLVEQLGRFGVRRILALRGDAPVDGEPPVGAFSCARDLVQHLAKRDELSLAVAGYPETHRDAASPEADLSYLHEKVGAGGEVIFTQLFFDPAVYFDFVARARARGLTAPIVPGVMPISSASQLERFTTMCGATIPNRVRSALDELSTPEEVSRFGIAYAIEQCQTLLAGGAPGIHFYTINRASQIEKIVSALQWQ